MRYVSSVQCPVGGRRVASQGVCVYECYVYTKDNNHLDASVAAVTICHY